MDKIVAIIPAAGQGKRMGNQVNKQFLCLAGLPILVHTLTVLENHPRVEGMIIVCRDGEREFCRTEIVEKYQLRKVLRIVAGGKERQHSVFNGIKALPADTGLVLIHDGARPFLTAGIIDKAVDQALAMGAAVAAVPVKDTIKEAGPDGIVAGTPDRSRLWQIQTPQVFRYSLIREAHQQAATDGFLGTDDASLVEYIGRKVKLVQGSYENIKITTPEDLLLGEAILKGRLDSDG